MEGYKSLSQ